MWLYNGYWHLNSNGWSSLVQLLCYYQSTTCFSYPNYIRVHSLAYNYHDGQRRLPCVPYKVTLPELFLVCFIVKRFHIKIRVFVISIAVLLATVCNFSILNSANKSTAWVWDWLSHTVVSLCGMIVTHNVTPYLSHCLKVLFLPHWLILELIW